MFKFQRVITPAELLLALLAPAAGCISAAVPPPLPVETPAKIEPVPSPPAAVPSPGQPVIFVDGQLTINAVDVSLGDILAKVSSLTGLKIDAPEGLHEVMHILKFGPGPARDVLASLLSDSNVDFLIQASDSDPGKLQSLMIMPRAKKEGALGGTDAETRPVSPYVRSSEPATAREVPLAADTLTAKTDDKSGADPGSPSPQAPLVPPDSPSDTARVQAQGNKTYPVPPPATLTSQSINQTLQQMYQQRVQQIQQDRQGATPTNLR